MFASIALVMNFALRLRQSTLDLQHSRQQFKLSVTLKTSEANIQPVKAARAVFWKIQTEAIPNYVHNGDNYTDHALNKCHFIHALAINLGRNAQKRLPL